MAPRLSILIYHRVLPAADPLQPDISTAAGFEARMRWLRRVFRILPLSDALTRLRSGNLPGRAMAITFDDGYADNAEVALPVLRRLGIPATFFIATGFLNGGRMWNDTVIETVRGAGGVELATPGLDLGPLRCRTQDEQRHAIRELLGTLKYYTPERRLALANGLAEACGVALPPLMMRESQVRELREAGMAIGAHTVQHPILASIGDAAAQQEIAQSKVHLEEILGERVPLFAYPNGKPEQDYTARDAAIVRDLGFDGAVSTAWGTALPSSDPFQLPRFTPWDRGMSRFVARLAHRRWLDAEASTAR